MPCRSPNRRARHGAGRYLGAIVCLAGAALAVHAARNGQAARRGAENVLGAATIAAAVLAAVAGLAVITWAAVALGRARRWQHQAPRLPEPGIPAPEPEPGVVPLPERLPGPPLFINGSVSRGTVAKAAADQEAAR
jgi:hypothetical protein